jgi:sugar/nucleoside kinase (ribokinase family)
MNQRQLLLSTARALKQRAVAPSQLCAFVGLDGFVDEIISVVDQRQSPASFTRVTTISQFARRIADAAGRSASIELVVERVKLGGNGPIMANALASLGAATTYVGALGAPRIHEVFRALQQQARVISVAEPGHTKALEFDDGKIMLGTLESLHGLTWQRLIREIGRSELRRLISNARLVAMTNWTMLPWMTEIWRRMQKEICPRLAQGPDRIFFADLADPTRRRAEELREALRVLAQFAPPFRVVLGLNLQEAQLTASALGLAKAQTATADQLAALIFSKLRLDAVVVHPREFAVSASARGLRRVRGPFTPKPKISTGAGDHFNAGYCLGRLIGLDEAGALQTGVGASGFYVRTGQSPRRGELAEFLQSLAK